MKVKLNADNLKKEIKKIRDLASTAETHRTTIDTECTNEHDPVSPTDFLEQSEIKIGNVRTAANEIESSMNTIISLNENGVGKMEGDNYTVDIPDSANITNSASLSEWASKEQAATDARDLQEVLNGDRKLPSRSYDQIVASIERNKQNGIYAEAFIDSVGPQNLTNLPLLVSSGQLSRELCADPENAPNNLAALLGDVLSTASRFWPAGKSAKVAEQIIGSVDEQNEYGKITVLNAIMGGHDRDGDGVNDLNFDKQFLLDMGVAAEKLDYKYIAAAALEAKARIGTYLSNQSFDPLAGILDAMGNNPDAALEFLAPAQKNKPGVADTSRLEKLSKRWQVFKDVDEQLWDQGGFTGLSAALAAASTRRSSPDAAVKARADKLADNTIQYVAANVYSGLYSESAKTRMGMFIANCSAEATSAWSSVGGNGQLISEDNTVFKAHAAQLNAIVYHVIDNPSAAATISAGLANYARGASQRGLEKNGDKSADVRLQGIKEAYGNASKAASYLQGLSEVKAQQLTDDNAANAAAAKESTTTVVNVFETVISAGIDAVGGPVASTGFSGATTLLNPIIVDAATGDAGKAKQVTVPAASDDSKTEALTAAALQDAANAGLLQQSDFSVPYADKDDQGNVTETASHEHYKWIVPKKGGGYTIDLSKGGSDAAKEVVTWAHVAGSPTSDRVVGEEGEEPPADEAIAKLEPTGKPGDGKAEGVTAGTNQRDQEKVQKEKQKAK